MNQINKLQKNQGDSSRLESEVDLMNTMERSLKLLGINLKDIKISGDNLKHLSNDEDLLTVFINIFSNSIKNLRNSGQRNRKISVEFQGGKKLTISYPKLQDFEESSGIGNSICLKLCKLNQITFDMVELNEVRYYELTFSS